MLREVKHESWETIAGKVVNLQGEHPCWGTVRNIVSEFNVSRGHRQYNYEKSGRKPWKLTPAVGKFIVKRLLQLRTECICTSTILQREVLKEHNVRLDASKIRQH